MRAHRNNKHILHGLLRLDEGRVKLRDTRYVLSGVVCIKVIKGDCWALVEGGMRSMLYDAPF